MILKKKHHLAHKKKKEKHMQENHKKIYVSLYRKLFRLHISINPRIKTSKCNNN